MFPEERAAAEVVAAGTAAVVLPGPPSGRHDADLVLPSDRTIGLEVTQAADREEIETWAAIASTRKASVPGLARWWSVGLASGARVKYAWDQLPTLLAGLEAVGATEHRWLANPHRAPCPDPALRRIEDRLDRLGVHHLHSMPLGAGKGGLSIVAHKDGGAVGVEDLVAAVKGEVWKGDNRRKLTEMTADERHLFVWLDHTVPAARSVLTLGLLLIPTIELPPELTTLWIAARSTDDDGNDWTPLGTMRLTGTGPWECLP